ncbi:MAG: PD40 domain-containing protein [Acidobacteria bacterium]|nr:PD40 domain-containing protein [Acidobacteriota bacterium]
MTNIGSNSSVQLLPFENVDYGGMKFSRDSSFLYFVKKVATVPALFKIPILGREPTMVLENVGYAFSFSPDGDRFCFVRKISESESAIVIVNADGSSERIVASRKAPGHFREGSISWSPAGNLIAIAAEDIKGKGEVTLIGVDVETGVEKPLSNKKWNLCNGLEWIGDGTGLVAGLTDADGSPLQIWFIPHPAGEPSKITNDLNNYGSISVTRNSDTIFAVQFSDESSLWVTPNGQPTLSQRITEGKHHLFKWVRWTTEGRLLFGSSLGGRRDVWAMNRDGSGLVQLTADASKNVMPVASGDGQYIVFGSTRGEDHAYHLWRANSNGREPQQLTFGIEELDPDITPDGRWVFYTSGKLNGPLEEKSIWKVSIDGGEPTRFIEKPARAPDVSPDGKFLLFWYKSDEKTPWSAAIFPLDGDQPAKTLSISPGAPIHWTTDGKGVSYLVTVAGVSNIWTLPIDGKPARQETNFTTDDIFDFDWSNDGVLVSSRISRPRDVVSIRNFR